MYAVSYLWYPAIGIVTVLLVGTLTMCVPYLRMSSLVPRKLLFPCLRRWAACAQCSTEDELYTVEHPDADDNKNMVGSLNKCSEIGIY